MCPSEIVPLQLVEARAASAIVWLFNYSRQ